MTEQELREKIIETLEKGGRNFLKSKETNVSIYEYYADALIAAGIGDVKEAEHRKKVLGRTLAIMKGKGLISGVVDDYIVQAEKELAEERKDD